MYIAYSMLGFTVPIFDPLYPYFSTTFGIGFDKIGLVFFGGSLIAILSNIIAGRICDHYPFRRILLFSFLVTFFGFSLFAAYQSFFTLIATVLIVNIGYNFVWPGSYSAVFIDFNENYSEIYVSLDKFYYFSTLFGPLLISLLFYLKLSPRLIFIFLAAVFGIMYIVFYFTFRREEKRKYMKARLDIRISSSGRRENYKTASQASLAVSDLKNDENSREVISSGEDAIKTKVINTDLNNDELECSYTYKGFRTIFKKSTVLSAITLTLFACVMVGSSAWLTTYFTSFDVPIFISSIFVSIYWFFTFIGLQLISKVLKYFSEAKILFYGGLLSSVGLVFYGIVPNIYVKIIFIIMVAIGVSGIYPLAAAISVRENPQASATASGFTVAMGIAGSLIIQPLMGFVAEYFNKRNVPFVLLIICLLGTFVAFLLVKHFKEPVFSKKN
ncbi:MAG: MFS transporter [Actinomycetota bacterium]|nr:MFS transporter [Actinomycetota bacterium]